MADIPMYQFLKRGGIPPAIPTKPILFPNTAPTVVPTNTFTPDIQGVIQSIVSQLPGATNAPAALPQGLNLPQEDPALAADRSFVAANGQEPVKVLPDIINKDHLEALAKKAATIPPSVPAPTNVQISAANSANDVTNQGLAAGQQEIQKENDQVDTQTKQDEAARLAGKAQEAKSDVNKTRQDAIVPYLAQSKAPESSGFMDNSIVQGLVGLAALYAAINAGPEATANLLGGQLSQFMHRKSEQDRMKFDFNRGMTGAQIQAALGDVGDTNAESRFTRSQTAAENRVKTMTQSQQEVARIRENARIQAEKDKRAANASMDAARLAESQSRTALNKKALENTSELEKAASAMDAMAKEYEKLQNDLVVSDKKKLIANPDNPSQQITYKQYADSLRARAQALRQMQNFTPAGQVQQAQPQVQPQVGTVASPKPVPPPGQRKPNEVYIMPNGKLAIWDGQGLLPYKQ